MDDILLQKFCDFIKACWNRDSTGYRISQQVEQISFRASIPAFCQHELDFEGFLNEIFKQKRILPDYGSNLQIQNWRRDENTLTVVYTIRATYDGLKRTGANWQLPTPIIPYAILFTITDILVFEPNNVNPRIKSYTSNIGNPSQAEEE